MTADTKHELASLAPKGCNYCGSLHILSQPYQPYGCKYYTTKGRGAGGSIGISDCLDAYLLCLLALLEKIALALGFLFCSLFLSSKAHMHFAWNTLQSMFGVSAPSCHDSKELSHFVPHPPADISHINFQRKA